MRQAIVVAFVVAIVMICLAGDVAPVMADGETQQGAGVCNYPRLNVLATSNTPGDVGRTVYLDAIANQFDAAHFAIDAGAWAVAGTRETVAQRLERTAPDLETWLYIPGGFFYRGAILDCKTHPVLCGAQALIGDDDWMRTPVGSFVTISQSSNVFLNPLTAIQQRLGAYWAAQRRGALAWADGLHFDLNETTLNRNGGWVDLDRNGVSDREERGLAWLDAVYRAGQTARLNQIAGPTVGNGAWQPGQAAYYDALSGIFVELGMAWRDPVDGVWKPQPAVMLRWQLDLIREWQAHNPDGAVMIVPKTELRDNVVWGAAWNDDQDVIRVALALALLTGGELVLPGPTMPWWCDECGVMGISTSKAPRTGDWLGCPLEEMVCEGDVCRRRFEGGTAWLNLGSKTAQVAGGEQTISGWYDSVYNGGQIWDGTLGPYSARVTVRRTRPPMSTPTPMPTATPTRTLAERVSALETAVFGPQ